MASYVFAGDWPVESSMGSLFNSFAHVSPQLEEGSYEINCKLNRIQNRSYSHTMNTTVWRKGKGKIANDGNELWF